MHLFKGGIGIAGLLLLTSGWALAQTPPPMQPSESMRLVDSTQGPALFSAYCTVCHGWEGKGDGPLAKSLKVAPSDLTRIAIRNGGKFPSQRIQRVISGQEAVEKGHGTGEMPVWGPIFSQIAWDQDLGHVRVYNLTRFIEGMQKK